MSKIRIKIPKKIENQVMLKSQGKCYCGKKGDHIHHLDKDPSNNVFDNLVLLCFDHHDDASVEKGLKKRLNQTQIKELRDKLYHHNEIKIDIELKHYRNSLKKITEETLFRASLDAGIVLEIIKIKSEFFRDDNWSKRVELLNKIDDYRNHSSLIVFNEIVELCVDISLITRTGMSVELSDSIYSILINFFPYSINTKEKKVINEIAEKCGNVALGIIYDSFIHLKNIEIACSGLKLLNYLFRIGNSLKLELIKQMVLTKYIELQGHLNRPDRADLLLAKQVLNYFKNNIEVEGLDYINVLDELNV